MLLAAPLCMPLCLMAVETDYMKDPKYLLGAVPEVDFSQADTVLSISFLIQPLSPHRHFGGGLT